MKLTQVGIINPKPVKVCQECSVETLTNGNVVVTVYGDTTNCETYEMPKEELK